MISRDWCKPAVIVLLLWSSLAQAVEVPDLYSAEAVVTDRSEEQRDEAFRTALAAVMVKVAGSREVLGDSRAQEVLDGASGLLQQYRYTADGTIWAAFDSESLVTAMRAAGLPVWGRDRPAVLLWLAVDWGGGRRGIVTADQDTELRRSIERVAASRGLPLVLPLFDSTDREQMSFSDLWGGFSDKIAAASTRYGPGAVLIGRASRGAGSRLFVRWELQLGDLAEQWEDGLSPGIHRAATSLAERFATRGGVSATATVVAVSGIHSLDDYARVLSYLERQSLVSGVQVSKLSGDTVVFSLQVQGDATRLFRVVDLDDMLEPHEPNPDQRISDVATYFRTVR